MKATQVLAEPKFGLWCNTYGGIMEKFHYVKDSGWCGESENLLSISVNETLCFDTKSNRHQRGYSVVLNGYSSEDHFADISVKFFKSKRDAQTFARKIAELLNEEANHENN